MTFSTDSHASADANWRQLEDFVEQLHELARAPITVEAFYRRVLDGCVTLLAAEGGAVWLPAGPGQWRPVYEVDCEQVFSDQEVRAAHMALLQTVATASQPQILLPHSRSNAGVENPTEAVLALVAVHDANEKEQQAIVELLLRPGSSPAVQQGWQELLATVSQIAAEFHVYAQLRTLRDERSLYDQSHLLSRRFQQTTDVRKVAFEIANEGRPFVAADRLSVLVRRGKSWRLLAASGVDRIEARADATRRLQALAAATAHWGEPVDFGEAVASDLPPALIEAIEQHVDQSQARRLIAVPLDFVAPQDNLTAKKTPSSRPSAVLIAEQFSNEASDFSQQRVLELAGLCEPALRQATRLDRFPIRNCLRWADRWSRVWQTWGFSKLMMACLAAMALVWALVFVQADFEIEAPATLTPIVERDVFATTDGKIVDVRITHGEQVAAGDILALLHDPQLSFDSQRVQGEIATTRKRLEAIAVARTDRQSREESLQGQLPLAAEAEQLKKQLASLQSQQTILEQRREALTLRSPIAGTLLTLDVQNLLQTRPVQRGQVLFTIADTTAGWRLLAEVPQDRIGQVVAAQQEHGSELAVRFRLSGDTENTYAGHIASISTSAVLDTAGLDQESPAFEVVVAVDDASLLAARPGMSAQARIHCGRRSLGYLWLHDIYETVFSWWVF